MERERPLPPTRHGCLGDLSSPSTRRSLPFSAPGGPALHGPNVLEKLLRDMSVAATHFMVDDSGLASYGQHLIETSPSPQPGRA